MSHPTIKYAPLQDASEIFILCNMHCKAKTRRRTSACGGRLVRKVKEEQKRGTLAKKDTEKLKKRRMEDSASIPDGQ